MAALQSRCVHWVKCLVFCIGMFCHSVIRTYARCSIVLGGLSSLEIISNVLDRFEL